jgi:hypothetical protein
MKTPSRGTLSPKGERAAFSRRLSEAVAAVDERPC